MAMVGPIRWMSPELLVPDRFGLSSQSPTRESDCYALGMVIYEVLGGKHPFSQYHLDLAAMMKIVEGEHPERPRSGWFPDGIWETLERCWGYQPSDRPSLGVVLHHLQGAAPRWSPPPAPETETVEEEEEEEDVDWSM